ncbi:hypothetical protein ASD89_00175 [Caulobacter sp. Root656]|nr:hypothetical protein ASD89_00175 [Caulobacter sp. Root656]
MYEAFNRYLATDTWHKSHPNDDERFYRALATVVGRSEFNADQMGEHFRKVTNVNRNDEDDLLNFAIDTRVTQADAIKEYLSLGLG